MGRYLFTEYDYKRTNTKTNLEPTSKQELPLTIFIISVLTLSISWQ